MGRGRKGSGVEVRGDSMRVTFTLASGERCRETLDEKATPPNLKYAERLVREIKAKIESGAFVYATYFPKSPRAEVTTANTLRTFGPRWLEAKGGEVGNNTRTQYLNAFNVWCEFADPDLFDGRPLGDIPFVEIHETDLKALIAMREWPSARLKNNYLIPLRGIFESACAKLGIPNPMAEVKNARRQKKRPDPFNAQQADQILSYMARTFDPRVWAYFNWQFATGMRPQETIALPRDNLDGRAAHVEVVRTGGENKDHTKTHFSRIVELNDRAMQSVEIMAHYWRDGDHGLVFERPEWRPGSKGGKPQASGPWNDARSQNDTYWKPTLKALGIRYRAPYKTRHTYATIGLMNRVAAAWLADQLGHDVKEFFATYARWINGAANSAEMQKMNAAMPANSPPLSPIKLRLVDIPNGINANLVGAIGLEPTEKKPVRGKGKG